jgi:hypothetical protein
MRPMMMRKGGKEKRRERRAFIEMKLHSNKIELLPATGVSVSAVNLAVVGHAKVVTGVRGDEELLKQTNKHR